VVDEEKQVLIFKVLISLKTLAARLVVLPEGAADSFTRWQKI
jgi:hypothetical protein